MSEVNFQAWTKARLGQVERALDACLPKAESLAADLPAAMRYSVLGGGKRVRPLLVYAAGEVFNADDEALDAAACAVELIHAYSLVHDDMPCMDNDVLRRGQPTAHVKFGEATALLAGDALQALAFQVLCLGAHTAPVSHGLRAYKADLCAILAVASGGSGMAGGQAIDLANIGKPMTEHQLRDMHARKTGALLEASVMMGATCGEASENAKTLLRDYAKAVGIAFQVVDDILDCTADSATLGKTAGKDAANNKPTYVSLLGMARSQAYAQELRTQAHLALDKLLKIEGLSPPHNLRQLADMIVLRHH
jgi:farnesyl diphosphate synthase